MTGYPSNSIFLYLGYFSTGVVSGTSTVRYNTTGTAPYRKFVISYDSIVVYSHITCFTNDYFTGEIILYETTNIIETHVKHGPDPYNCYSDNVTMEGVQNIGGTKGTGILEYYGFSNEGRRYTSYTYAFSGIPICIVSVDSATQKNMIVWDQPVGVPVDSFIFYRETSQVNVFAQIGNQIGNVFSTFIDTGSNPAVQANRYEIGFVDSCGNYTALSAPQKTIHLLVNQGMNNSWNLSWDAYEGFTFSSYYIYRGTTPYNMTLLATLASNLYSYTDLTPPPTVYYAIEVVNPGGCNPSARMEDGSSSSMSNIFNPILTTGINEANELNNVSVYPNPANSILNIKFNSAKNYEITFINVLGEEIYHQSINNSFQTTIDVSEWSNGVYIFQLIGEKETLTGKFVKE
jgi:type IX secretion system substrate protein